MKGKTRVKHFCITILLAVQVPCLAHDGLRIHPYVQNTEPNAISIYWEDDQKESNTLYWGTTTKLEDRVAAIAIESGQEKKRGTGETVTYWLHSVRLENLKPDTRYFYSIDPKGSNRTIYPCMTSPGDHDEDRRYEFMALSDMQGGWARFGEICNVGVPHYLEQQYGKVDLPEQLKFVLIPGDLLSNGRNYGGWKGFFKSIRNISCSVPIYPVKGNHEYNSAHYFRYFELPENGAKAPPEMKDNPSWYPEHSWYKDYGNVRIIGLDSNSYYAKGTSQLDWMKEVLKKTEDLKHIDFVVAQLHHPHHSELWPSGNRGMSVEVSRLLGEFSTNTGKPSLSFFGHTHAYAQGHSDEHRHMMFCVGVAGGGLDRWERGIIKIDEQQTTASHAEHGFMMIEVHDTEKPKLVMKYVSLGLLPLPIAENLDAYRLVEHIELLIDNEPPQRPTLNVPDRHAATPVNVLLKGSAFIDPEAQFHYGSHWQVAGDAEFSHLLYEKRQNYKNDFFHVDYEKGSDLTEARIGVLAADPGTRLYARVRYRDASLSWSPWSETVGFSIKKPPQARNALAPFGGAQKENPWQIVFGEIEAPGEAETALRLRARVLTTEEVHEARRTRTPIPGTGIGRIFQEVAIPDAYRKGGVVCFGGQLTAAMGTWASIRLEFVDADREVVGKTVPIQRRVQDMRVVNEVAAIPVNAKSVRLYAGALRVKNSQAWGEFRQLYLHFSE